MLVAAPAIKSDEPSPPGEQLRTRRDSRVAEADLPALNTPISADATGKEVTALCKARWRKQLTRLVIPKAAFGAEPETSSTASRRMSSRWRKSCGESRLNATRSDTWVCSTGCS